MKKATLILSAILGLAFIIFGINGFLGFLKMPKLEGPPAEFMGLLVSSGYLKAVKALEIVGGLLVLSRRYAPLGLVILMPILVNILFYDVFLAKAFNPLGTGLLAIALFLLWANRKNFEPLFAPPKA